MVRITGNRSLLSRSDANRSFVVMLVRFAYWPRQTLRRMVLGLAVRTFATEGSGGPLAVNLTGREFYNMAHSFPGRQEGRYGVRHAPLPETHQKSTPLDDRRRTFNHCLCGSEPANVRASVKGI
jgi:hypothetical protein